MKEKTLTKFISILLALILACGCYTSCRKKPVSEPEVSSEPESIVSEISIEEPDEPYVFRQFGKEIAAAKEANSDVVGWIYLRNTRINYPIYQYTDNDFYLKRNGKKVKNSNGSIFMDFRWKSSPVSQNTVIYGHNMASGKMFGTQKKYAKRKFLKDNPLVEFSTEAGDFKYKIFAVFYIEPTFDYIQPNPSAEHFQKILNKARKESLYKINNVEVLPDEQIVTLSTCAPSYMGDMRFVVMARLLRPDESHVLNFEEDSSSTSG